MDVLSPPANENYPLIFDHFTTTDTFKVIDIKAYQKLYVSVQAIDNSLRYSSFSETKEFIFPDGDFGISDDTVCTGTMVSATFRGISKNPPEFKWFVDNVQIDSLTSQEATFLFHDTGTYVIKLVVDDGGVALPAVERQVVVSEEPQLALLRTESACLDQAYTINYIGTFPERVRWNFGDATVVSGNGAGPYDLTWNTAGEKTIRITVDNEGCVKSNVLGISIADRPNAPSLCAVSVDDTSGKNKIAWQYEAPNVRKFNVYKETEVANHYSLVGTVNGTGTLSFSDETSVPEQHSDSYCVTAVDTCGFETVFSAAHRTIHLAISQGIGNSWNLIWTPYEGLLFDSYRIYRGEHRNDLTFLQDVSSKVTSFTDLDPPTENIYYTVEALLTTACDATSAQARYRSNVVTNLVSGVDEINADIEVSPNPTDGTLFVRSADGYVSYLLTDSRGYSAAAGKVREQQIDISGLASGIYILTATNAKHRSVKRIVKR